MTIVKKTSQNENNNQNDNEIQNIVESQPIIDLVFKYVQPPSYFSNNNRLNEINFHHNFDNNTNGDNNVTNNGLLSSNYLNEDSLVFEPTNDVSVSISTGVAATGMYFINLKLICE